MRNRIYIEITNRCNLSCDFCHGTRRPPRTMTPAEFETLALKLRGETDYLYLHVLGEPLLHPQLPELLAIAHRLGFRTCLVTNGTLLPRQKDALLSAHRVVELGEQAVHGRVCLFAVHMPDAEHGGVLGREQGLAAAAARKSQTGDKRRKL